MKYLTSKLYNPRLFFQSPMNLRQTQSKIRALCLLTYIIFDSGGMWGYLDNNSFKVT